MVERSENGERRTPRFTIAPRSRRSPELVAPLSVAGFDRLIGREIERRRHELGTSRKSLSKALDIPTELMAAYENGHSRMDAELLVLTATVLRCQPSAFFRSVSSATRSEVRKIQCAYRKKELVRGRSSGDDNVSAGIAKVEVLIKALWDSDAETRG